MNQSLLPTQSKPLHLKGKDGRDEAAYTDDSIVEVHESDRSGWEPEVKRVNDELLFGRCLGAVTRRSTALNLNMGLNCTYASRPPSLASRSTAELTFSSTAASCKREISAVMRWDFSTALIMLRVIPESQNLFAVLFALCAFSGDRLMNLIAWAQTIAS